MRHARKGDTIPLRRYEAFHLTHVNKRKQIIASYADQANKICSCCLSSVTNVKFVYLRKKRQTQTIHFDTIISLFATFNNIMIAMILLAFLISLSAGNDISEIFRQGFGFDDASLTQSPLSSVKQGKVPDHLQELLKISPEHSTDSNRFVNKRVSLIKVSQHKLTVFYNLRSDSLNHGVLKEAKLVIKLKTLAKETILNLSILGSDYQYNVSSDGTVTLPLPLIDQISSLTSLDIQITARQNLLSSHGIHVTSTPAISRIINLRDKPQLLLHYKNSAITQAPARAARRQLIEMFGKSHHHVNRRSATSSSSSSSFSHCRVRDLIINFANIGFTSVIAPAEFNARACSGECHVDHKETPMTNHAFIKNLMMYAGEEGVAGGAVCVSDRTVPLTVLVSVGGEFHLTVYEDMIVESCSCR